jgi:hypothetical protein
MPNHRLLHYIQFTLSKRRRKHGIPYAPYRPRHGTAKNNIHHLMRPSKLLLRQDRWCDCNKGSSKLGEIFFFNFSWVKSFKSGCRKGWLDTTEFLVTLIRVTYTKSIYLLWKAEGIHKQPMKNVCMSFYNLTDLKISYVWNQYRDVLAIHFVDMKWIAKIFLKS